MRRRIVGPRDHDQLAGILGRPFVAGHVGQRREDSAPAPHRDADGPEPFIQFFDEEGEGPFTLAYADIATIKFTGKDTAAGNSWKAWVERKEKERALKAAAAGPGPLGRDPRPDGG